MTTKKQEVRKVPNLRFPGFEGEWVSKKNGEVVDFKVTNSFSRENLNYEVGTVKNIHYGDIHTKFQTLFDITKEQVPFVNDNIFIGRISEDNYCKEGDIIFADASENLDDVGKSIEIVKLNNEKLLSGLHTLLARPKDNLFYKGFSGYLFQSNNVRLKIQKEAQGSKVLSISTGRIANIELTFPTLDEQQKISVFLSQIDERILLSSKIIEGLKSFKSAVSKKIFSQELRFKDDSGEDFAEWEEKKLGEVAEKRIKKNIDNKIINVFTNSAINGIVNQRDFFEKDIANQNNLNGYYIVENNDFVYNPRISSTAPVGPISRNHLGSGVMSPIYTVFRLKLGNVDFIECIFNTNVWHKHMENIANYGARADRMSFAIGDFYEMPIPFPSLSEQAKIANFLSSIDEKIETEEQILEQYKNQKAYLLQNMFI